MKIVRWAAKVGSWQPTEVEWTKAASLIQLEEKERIGKFYFKRDAKSSMLGRLLIRKFLSQATGLSNTEIFIERDKNGKPVYPCDPSVIFNVSHQGDFAVLAGVAGCLPGQMLGVDIMKLEYTGGKSLSEFFRIMTRNFSPKEWLLIKNQQEESIQLKEFCRHWSLKESYVKATGTGITVNLQNLSFATSSRIGSTSSSLTDTILYESEVPLNDWTFEESMLDEKHCVSLCRNFNVNNVENFQTLQIDELMVDLEPLNAPDVNYTANFMSKDEKP
ncbi:L-aminoadipate-semialdehyde dehydrogenase-phosphopantetheinyl transferase [Neocloeon triangulifer]|uniref:L-aminoadipate-semialdehyde dehydrogenase-phosphopantetheinyl transferase n=1 Tax=Neocloeon triangulifer TaxID=2078957 RepID=UPI00286EF725|nr:L-aminoadipate-semialdehyde dehydrogenase-phosphopantetheinyl transferase [Neocloeon triangulifer]XP_059480588.1 L-aminoadipate-semialdehyde dehydrogenase-phosphopantetheinyl transferase [Neocloeon triangulifer]